MTAKWTLPDGTIFQDMAVAAFQGIAQFKVRSGRGVYELCVVDVAKEGWLYDPNLHLETCTTLTVQQAGYRAPGGTRGRTPAFTSSAQPGHHSFNSLGYGRTTTFGENRSAPSGKRTS